MFSDGRNFTMFDRLRVRRDTNIDVWNRRWTAASQSCASIIDPVGRFDMLFVRHA